MAILSNANSRSGRLDKQLRSLQVGWSDYGGGAEQIAQELAGQYRARNHIAKLAVGRKLTEDGDVLELPGESYPHLWRRTWAKLGREFRARSGMVPWFKQL